MSTSPKTRALGLAVGDVVVYASHGIGKVHTRQPAAGTRPETIVVELNSGLRVTLPVTLAHDTLRPLSGDTELAKVKKTLRAGPADEAEPWSRRFRASREKVSLGQVTGLAEVVRDGLRHELALHGSGRTPAPSERHLYLQARKLLVAEIALARGIETDDADGWVVEQVGDAGSK